MSTLSKLLKNKSAKAGSLYLFGNLFDKAIAFITVPIFTRLMTTSDYGVVNTYLSWVSILSLVIGLSLGTSIRSAYIDFKEDLEGYISSIFFLSLINFLFVSIIILLAMYFYIDKIDFLLIGLLLVHSFMRFIINSMNVRYMMGMDYVKKTMLLSIPNILIVIISIILLVNINTNKYLGRILPYVLVYTIIGSGYIIRYFVKGKKFYNKKYWAYAINLSLPLIFHGLSMNILRASDRTMITVFRSTSETGIYSLVYSLSMITLVITTSLESIWIPWFNNKLQNNQKGIINKNVKIYIEFAMVSMIGILMIGPEVIEIMAPAEYWGGKNLIPPIVLASFFIFLYSISVDLEYYYKSTKVIAINTGIAAAINIILNLIFIPLYGALAAAITTVISYIVSFAIHYYAARKIDNQLFPLKVYIKPILIMSCATFILYFSIDLTILRWVFAVCGFTLYVLISYKKNRFEAFLK